MVDPSPNWAVDLSSARHSLGRTSTAERVADILRTHLIEGRVLPRTRLSEDAIAVALEVSRNTLREAFRLLSHERLLVHELNRGVFVRKLSVEDVIDIYRLRRILEVAALRCVTSPSTRDGRRSSKSADLRSAVTVGKEAADRGDWPGVGTANMHFHRSVAALANSVRVDELMSRLLAELRLVFHVMVPLRQFHEPYLADNDRIATLVEAGEGERAGEALLDYLERAERQLIVAYSKANRQSEVLISR